jgi:aryl sulfotransferase
MSPAVDHIRSHTVWCASYPKSGNTWVRTLAHALRTGKEPDINRLGAEGHASADVMRSLGLSTSDMSETMSHAFVRLGWALGRDTGAADATTLRKTHTPWLPLDDGYPQCWQPPDARAVYIVRDPRAVAVSWAHHIGHSHADAVNIMATARSGIPSHNDDEHQFHPGDWSIHVRSWLDQSDIPILVLRYEDLQMDPVPTVTRLAQWLNLPSDEDRINFAIDACAFEKLAVAEITHGFAEAAAPRRVFFRRGEIDSWREELAPDLVAQIEVRHGEVMRRLGYLS